MASERPLSELSHGGENPRAQRILEIDDELEALRRKRPTLFGVVARVCVALSGVMGGLDLLGSDSNAASVVLFGAVGVWAAVFGVPLLNAKLRTRSLEREIDALISEPLDRLDASRTEWPRM